MKTATDTINVMANTKGPMDLTPAGISNIRYTQGQEIVIKLETVRERDLSQLFIGYLTRQI